MTGETIRRILLAALLALGLPAGRVAGDDDDHRPQRLLPLQTALARVEARFDGAVIDADLVQAGKGRVAYEVRLLTRRGSLIRILLDASTGVFLEVEGHGFVEAQR
ncbi:MAG: PepSY domain-containing protein [Alphaproteobacteria bacterium]